MCCVHFSLKDFVSGASEYAINMVDNLLDILTSGQHSKSIKTIEAEVSFTILYLVLGRSSIIINNQSFASLLLINRLRNWQSIIIGKGGT